MKSTQTPLLTYTLTMLLTLGLASCGKDNKKEVVPTEYAQAGVIVDFINDSGKPQKRKDALFAFNAATKSTTNIAGYARLEKIPTGSRQLLNVIDDESFAPQLLAVDLKKGENLSHLEARLLKLYAPTNQEGNGYNPAVGGSFKVRGGGQVTLGQSAINTSEDRVWRIYLSNINVSDERLLPADMKAKTKTGDTETIESLEAFGGLYASIKGSSKTNLTSVTEARLKNNTKAKVRIAAQKGAPATAKLYAFDYATGYWQAQGLLTLDTATNQYIGETSKLGYLAAMSPVASTTSLSGCVASAAGKPLARAQIKAFGGSYSGYQQTRTDSQGKFNLPIKSGQKVTLVAKLGQYTKQVSVDASKSSAVNGGNCIVLDAGAASSQVRGKVTWENTKERRDFDVNIILPNGDIMFYNKRTYKGIAGDTIRIVEDANGAGETITYNSPMKGRHFIGINRYFDQYANGITSAKTKLVLKDKTFTPPKGEVENKTSQLRDGRSHVWLAAVMEVAEDCQVTIQAPKDVKIKNDLGRNVDKKLADWLTNDAFINLYLYKGGVKYQESQSDANYCQPSKK